MLLETWQRCKNHTLAKLLQGFRQQVTWPTLLGILSRRIFGWQQQKVKNHQTFYSYLRANLLDEREKIRARSLQRLNYTSFLFVFFVILKCNSLSFLINLYFHTFNWHIQVLIMQKARNSVKKDYLKKLFWLCNTLYTVPCNVLYSKH